MGDDRIAGDKFSENYLVVMTTINAEPRHEHGNTCIVAVMRQDEGDERKATRSCLPYRVFDILSPVSTVRTHYQVTRGPCAVSRHHIWGGKLPDGNEIMIEAPCPPLRNVPCFMSSSTIADVT